MSLDSLPVELLELICEECQLKEIKALRLTSRTLRDVADRHLFSEIVTVMSRTSLHAAQEISEDPHFAKQPRVLCIQGDRNRRIDFDTWKAEVEDLISTDALSGPQARRCFEGLGEIALEEERTGVHTVEGQDRKNVLNRQLLALKTAKPQRSYTTEQLIEHFNHYDDLVQEGLEVVSDGTFRQCMRNVFENCPNLDVVEFTLANCLRVHTHKHNKTFKRGLITPSAI
ncbi:Putative F-box domain-containing protein [Septoria linicola]|uniref:F-box domain-containing protein n=1 Tax=Septoria linicola TaxID=215465 RepID=A0A9Q9EJH7_9PEZI|nr:Putative F-box domain-containing protein [Septoria linicola]